MLLFSRRFLPFFITQFGGAFTDNLYKNALLVYLTLRLSDSKTLSFYTNLSMALFIFPMFLFSAWSGLLADRFEKRFLIVRIKWLEVFIMAVGIVAFAAALQGWWGVRLSVPLRSAALAAGALCFVPHTSLRLAGILASLGLGYAARRGGSFFVKESGVRK